MTTRVVVATGNAGKLREFRTILRDLPGIEIVSLAEVRDLGEVTFPDEGTDYRANAIAKARAVADQLGLPAIADDSGIEVDALGGAPGPLSARYGGPELDDAGRVAKLLGALADVPDGRRGARFYCVASLAEPDGGDTVAEGICPGRILSGPRGAGGFGYDPVFQPDGHDGAMAELDGAIKDEISHRARALAGLRSALAGLA